MDEVMDEIERECEELGLDKKEIQTVLDCTRNHLGEGVRGSAFKVLWNIVGCCEGPEDRDLCYRVLERVEAKHFHKEGANRRSSGAI